MQSMTCTVHFRNNRYAWQIIETNARHFMNDMQRIQCERDMFVYVLWHYICTSVFGCVPSKWGKPKTILDTMFAYLLFGLNMNVREINAASAEHTDNLPSNNWPFPTTLPPWNTVGLYECDLQSVGKQRKKNIFLQRRYVWLREIQYTITWLLDLIAFGKKVFFFYSNILF